MRIRSSILAETGSGEMHNFFRVWDVLRTAGDHLIVADGASQQIRVYDSAGRFVRAFGGPGEGPGEFRFLRSVVLMHSGRFVGVDNRGPGAEFDIDSGLVATFRMPAEVRPPRHPVPSDVVWGLDNGYTVRGEGLRQGFQRTLATIVRLSEDRMSAHPVASVPGSEHVIVPSGDANPLLGRRTHAVPTSRRTGTYGAHRASGWEWSRHLHGSSLCGWVPTRCSGWVAMSMRSRARRCFGW